MSPVLTRRRAFLEAQALALSLPEQVVRHNKLPLAVHDGRRPKLPKVATFLGNQGSPQTDRASMENCEAGKKLLQAKAAVETFTVLDNVKPCGNEFASTGKFAAGGGESCCSSKACVHIQTGILRASIEDQTGADCSWNFNFGAPIMSLGTSSSKAGTPCSRSSSCASSIEKGSNYSDLCSVQSDEQEEQPADYVPAVNGNEEKHSTSFWFGEEEDDNEGCSTPRALESKIPVLQLCPPAPRKRKVSPSKVHRSSFLIVPDVDVTFSN